MKLDLNYPFWGFPQSANSKILALTSIQPVVNLEENYHFIDLAVVADEDSTLNLSQYQKLPFVLSYAGANPLTVVMLGKSENYEVKITPTSSKKTTYYVGEAGLVGGLFASPVLEADFTVPTAALAAVKLPAGAPAGLTMTYANGVCTYKGTPQFYPRDLSQDRLYDGWFVPFQLTVPTGFTPTDLYWIRDNQPPIHWTSGFDEVNWQGFTKPGVKEVEFYWSDGKTVLPQIITLDTIQCDFVKG